MLKRFANVTYWICAGITILFIPLTIAVLFEEPALSFLPIVAGVVFYGAGWLIFYILTGEKKNPLNYYRGFKSRAAGKKNSF